MSTPQTETSRGNSLLEAIRGKLAVIEEYRDGYDVLIEADEPTDWLFFPHVGSIISLTRATDSGVTVEVGIVGYEGVATAHALLAPNSIGAEGVVQLSGTISRVSLAEVRELMNTDAAGRELILAYAGAFLTQVSQHALCNRLHTIEQRLAKWLLGVRDRIDTDDIGLTHDFLSHMLGIRRSGVTVAVGALALDGLVRHSRNNTTITDREGLESRACECRSVIVEATRPLLEQLRTATATS